MANTFTTRKTKSVKKDKILLLKLVRVDRNC